jgi:hypothetical protein
MITLRISCNQDTVKQCDIDLRTQYPNVSCINHEKNNHTLMELSDYDIRGAVKSN